MAAPGAVVAVRVWLTEFGSNSICQVGICCKGARSDPRHIPKLIQETEQHSPSDTHQQ